MNAERDDQQDIAQAHRYPKADLKQITSNNKSTEKKLF